MPGRPKEREKPNEAVLVRHGRDSFASKMGARRRTLHFENPSQTIASSKSTPFVAITNVPSGQESPKVLPVRRVPRPESSNFAEQAPDTARLMFDRTSLISTTVSTCSRLRFQHLGFAVWRCFFE